MQGDANIGRPKQHGVVLCREPCRSKGDVLQVHRPHGCLVVRLEGAAASDHHQQGGVSARDCLHGVVYGVCNRPMVCWRLVMS